MIVTCLGVLQPVSSFCIPLEHVGQISVVYAHSKDSQEVEINDIWIVGYSFASKQVVDPFIDINFPGYKIERVAGDL